MVKQKVVIIGAGTVGEFATRSALGLGANVKVFDSSITRLRKLQVNVGRTLYTSTLQPKYLMKALRRCDVAIGALFGLYDWKFEVMGLLYHTIDLEKKFERLK